MLMSSFSLRSFCAATSLALAAPWLTAATTTAAGSPVGVVVASFATGTHPLAFPLLGQELFVGIVTGNSGVTVSFASGLAPAAKLLAGGKYYLEVATGSYEGERLDLDVGATLAAAGSAVKVDLSTSSFSTTPGLASDALIGARVVIRPHVTLATLQAMFSPALVGNNSSAAADSVLIYSGGNLYTYYLRADGVTWRQAGKAVDERSKVIPPDSSLAVQLRSGTKRWTHTGDVRTNVFRVWLTAGSRAFATGFPLDLTPIDIGAFVDPEAASVLRWTGNDTPTLAATLKIYNPATAAFQTYYLRGAGAGWSLVGATENLATTPLLGATDMVVLTRIKADPEYLIIRPFDL